MPTNTSTNTAPCAQAVDARLQVALQAHQAGRLAEAEAGYREILDADASHADAWHLLGLLHQARGEPAAAQRLIRQALALREDPLFLGNLGHQLKQAGRTEEAQAAYRRALELDPGLADIHFALANLLKAMGRNKESEAAYRHAFRLDPGHMDALTNLGNLLTNMKRLPEAEITYRRAIELRPNLARCHNNLGVLLKERKRWPEAEASLRQAIALQPGYVEAHVNLGNLLSAAGRLDEAEAAYRRAIELNPASSLAHNNLGNLLKDSKRWAAAEDAYDRALAIDPHDATVVNNRGNLLATVRRLAEAEAAYRRALELQPDFADAHNNLGALLHHCNRMAEAEAAYRRALELQPGKPEVRLNLGTLLLTLGRYAEGWPLYEARPDVETDTIVEHPQLAYPRWAGEPLAGKSLVLWPEQGFGDGIQFVRYARLLKAQGAARITVACREPLKALLATAEGVDAVVTDPAQLVAHDYWSFLLSVPRFLGTTVQTIPASLPYLHALPAPMAAWRDRLPSGPLRVGLVWKGSPGHKNDANRSLPDLTSLAPLWAVPGVHFVSLQKGRGEDEALQPPPGQPLVALGGELENFADAAAVVSQLDLVICVDTAIAHLAGALGVRTWVLLPALGTDWRWLQNRTDSPWYPAVMRLFRQVGPDGWGETIARLAAELRALAETQADLPSQLRQAVAQHNAGLVEEAERAYRRILAYDAAHADTLHLLGVLRGQAGDAAGAETLMRQALAQREEILFLRNLGKLLKDTQRLSEAEPVYLRALELDPASADLHLAVGSLYRAMHRLPLAEAAYRRALELAPGHFNSLMQLGHLLREEGRYAEATASYRSAIESRPAAAEAHYRLAVVLHQTLALTGQASQAEAEYRRAIELDPRYAQAQLDLGLLLLYQGRFGEGWPLYEARYDPSRTGSTLSVPNIPIPQWKGQSLSGKTLLLWAEQGFGDTLQFVRFAPLLKARGVTRLTLVCDEPLRALMATAPGLDAIVAIGDTGPADDYWTLAMSVPRRLGTTLETIPADLPYLSAPPDRIAQWAHRLPGAGLKVGLVWKGAAKHPGDAHRSMPGLSSLAPLWDVPGVSFVSLQKGQDEDAALAPPPGQPMTALGRDMRDFADAAAIVCQLDLVICVDTAIAHLAGALGKPVWVLLHSIGTDWRWLSERSDSPWYPGVMRLFRQARPGDWDCTVAEVAQALQDWAARRA